jgi:hypothetical protein
LALVEKFRRGINRAFALGAVCEQHLITFPDCCGIGDFPEGSLVAQSALKFVLFEE